MNTRRPGRIFKICLAVIVICLVVIVTMIILRLLAL